MKLTLPEWLTWKHKKQKHLRAPITSIRSGMALTSKKQLLVLAKRLCNIVFLLPAVEFSGLRFFKTAHFTADRSKDD